jgi:putative inorganic carbon (HCO3(-)) transporter
MVTRDRNLIRAASFATVATVLLCLTSTASAAADPGAFTNPNTVPTASQPNQQLIDFFQSPAGVVIEVLALAFAAIACTFGAAQWLRRAETQDRVPRTKSARKRARAYREPRTSGSGAMLPTAYRLLAGLVAAAALILPLTFSILINDDVFAFPKTVGLTIFALAIGIGLIGLLVLGARPARPRVLEVAITGYVVLAAIATVTAVDPAHSILGERTQYQGLVSVVAYAVLLTGALVSVSTEARARVLSIAILISSAVTAGYALVQWFGFDPIWAVLYKGRVFSTVGQANALATTLAAGAIVGLTLEPTDRLRRAAVIGGVALSVAALIVTFSRGGYVAFAVGLLVVGLVLAPGLGQPAARRWAGRLVASVVVATLIVGIPSVIGRDRGDVGSRVVQRTASIADASEGSNRAHLDLWTVGLRIALDHPVIGTGPDSYALVFPDYRDEVLSPESAAKMTRFRPESPHNVYLAIASGAGFPALVAFVGILLSCLVLGLRAARGASVTGRLLIAGLLGAVTVHLVTIVFMTAEPATFALLWIMLGALAGLGRAGRALAPTLNKDATRTT